MLTIKKPNRISRFRVLLFSALVLAGSSAFALPGSPSYNPVTPVIQGNQPLIAGSAVLAGTDPFVLTITAPSASVMGQSYYPVGGLQINLGVSIPTNVGANPGVPIGGNAATALSYCTVTPSTVTFSGPGATAQVIVTVNVPTPVVSGNYFWNVKGTNWPSTNVVDSGSTINANVLPPIANPTVKPVIANLLPILGTSFIYNAPTPVAIPISFDATCVSAPNGGAAISTLKAQLDSTVLTLATTGLGTTNPDGTFSASGSVTPTISNSGPHTITVSAQNAAGTTTATTQINILEPAKITNTNSPSFSYAQSGSFAVTATGYPAPTFTASGLPAWATLNPTTGVITGAPTSVGAFTFTVTAANSFNNVSVGTDAKTFTLTVSPAALTVTANAASKNYGAADPATLSYTLTGTLAPSDTLSGALARVAGDSVGTYAINQGTLAANANYTLTYVGANFTINPAPLTVTAMAASKVYGASDPATLNYTLTGTLIGSDTLSGALARVAGENVGSYAINQNTLAATANYKLTYVGANFTITQAPQTITFAALAPVAVGATPFALTATGGASGNPVTYTSNNVAVATVNGSTVTVVGAGTAVITANQAGNLNYSAAPAVSQTLTVTGKQNQTIAFGTLAPVVVGSAPFTLTATASSGLAVSYTSSNPAVATVSGSTVTVVSAGTTVITASQPGDANYNAATPVARTLTVTAAQNCSTGLMWLTPISLDKIRQGGSVLPIKFHLQECCGVSPRDPDANGDFHSNDHNGHGDDNGDDNGEHDDDGHSDRSDDHSGNNAACHHGADGYSTNNSNCRHDCNHDEDDRDGCANLRDTTVVISIYEVGSTAPATQYKYGTGSPNPPDFAIDGDYKYQLNFPTAKGKHTYHIDVYRFPAGTTAPVLVGSKEFSTK